MIGQQSEIEKRPWSSEEWCAYFRANATAPRDIPWERGAEVSPQELAAIAGSVQGFQLGESSEGRHLLQCATAYAIREEEPAYREAMMLFIGEEQRHARELGRFLKLAGVPLISRTWPDTVFRWLRHRAGLELSIAVLLTAEIIAKVYYAALREATGSLVLRRLCDHILADEKEQCALSMRTIGNPEAKTTDLSPALVACLATNPVLGNMLRRLAQTWTSHESRERRLSLLLVMGLERV